MYASCTKALTSTGGAKPLGTKLLSAHFRADAAAREAIVAWFVSRVPSLFIVSTLALFSLIGWRSSEPTRGHTAARYPKF